MGVPVETLILVIALALGGLAVFVAGLRRLLQRRFATGAGMGTAGALVLASGVLGLAVLSNLYTYQRLTHEQLAAEVLVEDQGGERYRAVLMIPGEVPRNFELRGDQWQLDARILKWHGVATLLGLDTLYRLERLQGRYAEIARARQAPRTVYPLTRNAGLDLWRAAERHGRWLPWVDAYYGSATYMPLADGARFRVYVSATGLVTRPGNVAAERAIAGWN